MGGLLLGGRWARRGGPTVVACIALLAVANGCKEEETCPERFNVSSWCIASDSCTVDGSVTCQPDCIVAGGQLFRIPLATVAPQLRAHDLSVVAGYEEPIQLPPTSITVAIDGRVGMHDPVSSGESIVRWDPFPTDPQEMTLTFDLATTAVLYLGFVDYLCDLEHPAEPLSLP